MAWAFVTSARPLATTTVLLATLALACGAPGTPALPDASHPADTARDAAPPDWPDRLFGGAGDDELLDVVVAGDALIVAGYRDGTLGLQNLEPGGNPAGVIERFAFDGTLLARHVVDTPDADVVDALHDGADDLAFVGRTAGALPAFTSGGQVDAFVGVVARDLSGPVRVVQLGDERPQHPRAIARDAGGGLLVAGYDDVYVVDSAVHAFENAWTAHVSPALEVRWTRRADTPGSDWYFALAAPGPAGEMLVGGQILSGAERGAIVSRLDADGIPRWHRRIDTIGVDAVTAIAHGPDGLYVAGATLDTLGDRSYGQQDIFVAVIDPATGTITRTMQAGSTESDYPRDLAVAADGTVYVVGETLGALPGAVLAGDHDVVVVRFAADGTWTGGWQHGTSGDDTGTAIALAPHALFVVGYTHGALVDGASPLGGRDGFVMTVPPARLREPSAMQRSRE